MKKILLTVPTLSGGGAERVVSRWANSLKNKGYDVNVLIYGHKENEYILDEKINLYTIAKTYKDYQRLNYIKRLKIMRGIIKIIKADVIINFLPRMQIWVMLSSIGLKKRRIETVRVSPWEISQGNKIEKLLWRICMLTSDKIIVQTKEQVSYFSKIEKKKCTVISNPISENFVKGKTKDYKEEIRKFISIGRITKQKNFEMLIAVFKELCKKHKNIILDIYGVGEDIKYFEKLKNILVENKLERNIFFKGRTKDIQNELLEHDIFLMSSNFEGMPNALLEAMVCGLVSISTNCKTGPKDLIDHTENGFLVEVNGIQEMIKQIEYILKLTPKELQIIGIAARNKILKLCGEDNSIKKLINLIED